MNYYFYYQNGDVYMIYYMTPTEDLLCKDFVASDKVFEEKTGYDIKFKVDVVTKELTAEYTPTPLTEAQQIELLQQENAMLTDYALDLDLRLLTLETSSVRK